MLKQPLFCLWLLYSLFEVLDPYMQLYFLRQDRTRILSNVYIILLICSFPYAPPDTLFEDYFNVFVALC